MPPPLRPPTLGYGMFINMNTTLGHSQPFDLMAMNCPATR